jgi:hypothetical protein
VCNLSAIFLIDIKARLNLNLQLHTCPANYVTVRRKFLLEELALLPATTYILRSPKAHYRTHNSPSLVPESNKLYLPSHPMSLISTIILFSHLRLVLPSCLFHSNRCQVTFAHMLPCVHNAIAHFKLLVLIITTQKMFVAFLFRCTQTLGECTLIGHGRFVSH